MSQVKFHATKHSPAKPEIKSRQSLINCSALQDFVVPFCLRRKTHELGEENRRLLPVSGPPLPLARIQRSQPARLADDDV